MKRKLLIVSAFILSLGTSYGQEVLDAYRYSQRELKGTARSMSMGGAFGALGGDITGVSINPAGIGVYKSSEIVTTLNIQNIQTETTLNAGANKEKKTRVNFDNFAFVGTFPLHNDVAPLINFGFSYNKLQNFDRKYSMKGNNLANSLSDHMAYRANKFELHSDNLGTTDANGDYNMDVWRTQDWLSVMGYNSRLIDGTKGDFSGQIPGNPNNRLNVAEKGSVNTYDFNFGTTFADMLSAGLTISVTDISYRMSSLYSEDLIDGDAIGGFDLDNILKTEGTGWQLGLGVIFKPINELRLGVAYHSPTWYNMSDRSSGILYHDLNDFYPGGDYSDESIQSFDGYWSDYDYQLRTPDRWTFSAAGVIGANAIISVDYELTDYKKMKFYDRDGYEYTDGTNEAMTNQFRLASTLRVGAEYRITPQFSGRVGYSWQQSPLTNSMKDGNEAIYTAGSVTQYTLDDDINYYTFGLGYRFTRNIYTDIAFVYKTQKSDLYFYEHSPSAKMKNDTFQGSLTLGFRF